MLINEAMETPGGADKKSFPSLPPLATSRKTEVQSERVNLGSSTVPQRFVMGVFLCLGPIYRCHLGAFYKIKTC